MATNKGFIKDWWGNYVLPMTRGELVLDKDGNVALNSEHFLAGANGNGLPGLITAAERAMLSGSGSGTTGGIKDIYEKLDFINYGLKFNNVPLNFYNTNNVATPINILADPLLGITLRLSENVVNIGLTELTSVDTVVNNIVKDITVDKYGRVTNITGSPLTDSDIPQELSEKTISNSILTNCVTNEADIGSNERAIANKAYVDAKFREVTGIATGALKFGGALSDASTASNALSNALYLNHYFKVTKEFAINKGDLYDTTGIVGNTVTVKAGDTLIVYSDNGASAKFVYIPSGDDITTITVSRDGDSSNVLESAIGNVLIRFSSIFSATAGNNSVYIAMSPADASHDGYLTKEDYNNFKNYASQLKVDYTGEFSNGTGVYKIGTLTIGTDQKEIFGKYNVSSLSLEDGTDSVYNPILKFTETGATDVDITLKGFNGILIKRNGNTVEFGAANEVIEQDVPQEKNPRKTKYLTIENGYQFGVQIGRADALGNVEQDGLTDFSQFNALVNRVSIAATFEAFTYSLSDAASTTEYRYGNDLLKEAINVTI